MKDKHMDKITTILADIGLAAICATLIFISYITWYGYKDRKQKLHKQARPSVYTLAGRPIGEDELSKVHEAFIRTHTTWTWDKANSRIDDPIKAEDAQEAIREAQRIMGIE